MQSNEQDSLSFLEMELKMRLHFSSYFEIWYGTKCMTAFLEKKKTSFQGIRVPLEKKKSCHEA
jgi:hypothetical protein